jgi:hypothetical protein
MKILNMTQNIHLKNHHSKRKTRFDSQVGYKFGGQPGQEKYTTSKSKHEIDAQSHAHD